MMKAYVVLLFLLFGIVAAQASCPTSANILAPWYCSQINQAAVQTWTEWEPIAVAVVLASFMLAAIIFAIGVAINNSGMKNFGISEIYEAVATMIIVAMFSLIVAELFGILPSAIAGPIDPYNATLNYIAHNINETSTLVKALYNTYMVASYYSSIGLTFILGSDATGTSEVINTNMLYTPLINIFLLLPIDAIISIILDGLLLLYVEFYLIVFAMYASIPVFFIPGIILRAIYPTRSVGGMLMAMGIGFYLIMPTLFGVAYYATTGSLAPLYSQTQAIEANSQGTGAITNAISPTSPLVLDLKGIQEGMGTYWMAVLFFPALIIAVTYESIMIIGNFIGGFSRKSKLLRAV